MQLLAFDLLELDGEDLRPRPARTPQGGAGEAAASRLAWAVWAGVRTADGGGPVEPHWVRTREVARDVAPSSDELSDWLLMSTALMIGRVHRPRAGPGHDPHWMLFGPASTSAPIEHAGWAASTEEAQARLRGAWCSWLAWAELAAAPTAATT